MKRAYFLRGLGAGILFTAILFTIINNGGNKKSLTDQEIIVKAKQLGMVESIDDKLDQIEKTANPSSEPTANPTQLPTESPTEPSVTPTIKPTIKPTTVPTVEPTVKPTVKPHDIKDTTSDNKGDGSSENYITITVTDGMSSAKVAYRLSEKGAVDDPKDFNKYLSDNGYALKIKPGTYLVPMNASYSQLAKLISH